MGDTTKNDLKIIAKHGEAMDACNSMDALAETLAISCATLRRIVRKYPEYFPRQSKRLEKIRKRWKEGNPNPNSKRNAYRAKSLGPSSEVSPDSDDYCDPRVTALLRRAW